jgi:hypothetical protein
MTGLAVKGIPIGNALFNIYLTPHNLFLAQPLFHPLESRPHSLWLLYSPHESIWARLLVADMFFPQVVLVVDRGDPPTLMTDQAPSGMGVTQE